MYNESIKRQFLERDSVGSGKKNYVVLCEIYGGVEEKQGKDIALFSKSELIDAIENTGICNMNTLSNHISFLRTYRLWYNDNIAHCEVTFVNYGLLREVNLENTIRKTIFFSPEELAKSIADGSHLDGKGATPALILSWCGLDLEQMVKIEKKDVSFTSKRATIKTGNKKIIVDYPRFVSILKEYYELVHISKTDANKNYYVQQNDVYLFRRFVSPNKDPLPHMVTRAMIDIPRLSEQASKKGKRVSLQAVRDSGELYRMLKEKGKGNDLKTFLKTDPKLTITKIRNKLEFFAVYEKVVNSLTL